MIVVRKSEERSHIQNNKQNTWMTFNGEDKTDSLQKGFGVLKIFNEEVLPPGNGFMLHTHKNMIIVTYVAEGVIVYKGPLEFSNKLLTNEFYRVNTTPRADQYITNVSPSDDAHVFQSGFLPPQDQDSFKEDGIKKFFTQEERRGILRLIASSDGRENSLSLQQDVEMYSTFIHKGNHMVHEVGPGRQAWLHVVSGRIVINELTLQKGDGAGFTDERSVSFIAEEPTEILLFDLCAQPPEEVKAGTPIGLNAAEILQPIFKN